MVRVPNGKIKLNDNIVNSIKLSIRELIQSHRIIFIISVLSLLSGIVSGAAAYRLYDTETANALFKYMQNYFIGGSLIGVSPRGIFGAAVADALKLTVIIFISGLSIYLCPLAFMRLYTKGFAAGLTITFFLSRYMVKGIIFALITVFLCDIITVPAMVIITTALTAQAARLRSMRDQKQRLATALLQSLVMAAVMFVMLLCGAVLQSFVSPGMVKIFYSMLSGI